MRCEYLAAVQGEPLAQFSLGVMYYQGQGVERDDKEAVEWYRPRRQSGKRSLENDVERIVNSCYVSF
jgi:TPR repeat protein